ncbi:MarR family transcriptional regulator, partial [Rhizobium ruizarguesonis]
MDVPFKEKDGRQKTAATEAQCQQAQYTLGEQIGFYLRQANQRHVAIFASLMAEKLTTTQWAALVRLKDLQPCSQGNLG